MQALIQFWLDYNDVLISLPVMRIIAKNIKIKRAAMRTA